MAFKREEVYSATLEYFKGDELAANVWIDKYCLKEKAGKEIVYHELTPDDMHYRLSKELARIEAKYPNPMSEDEIFELIEGFKYIVPQGSPMAGIGNNFALSSISNCFVVGGHVDSYGGIMNADEEQVQLMKRRGGVGNDLSHLRPALSLANGAPLGPNAGATLYMDRYSNSTKEVQQDGRRGALMLSISIIHPDAGKFIDKKMSPGQVTGANVSVKVVDDFMDSLKVGSPFYQVFPIDYSIADVFLEGYTEMEFDELYEGRIIDGQKTYFKKLDPNKLWEKIVFNAWKSAEPGILFWDKIISESPVNGYGPEWTEVSTNPCGEIPLCPYDSCRLLAINLFSYIHRGFTKYAMLEDAMLIDHVKKAMRLMDDIVDLEIEKVNKIIKNVKENDENETFKRVELELWGKILEKAEQGRRTGFGVLGEGDLIAAIGYRYGTPEATLFSEKLHQLIATAAFESSVELAKERGAFPIFNHENEQGGFLNRMIHDNELMTPELLEEYKLFGRRNIGMLTIAPTGTTALMTQTTSGIEPLFTPFYYRKKKVVAGEEHDFVDQDGELMKEFTVLHRPFIKWYATEASVTESIAEYQLSKLTKEAMKLVFEASPYYNATAQDVDYIEKVKMQGAVQKWVDHSISVTVNMPEHASKDTVAGVYKTAWESGCKGITVYREGSRGNVLATESVKVGAVEEFEYISALERPDSVDCDVYFRTAHKEDFIIFVGVVGGKPYEIFAVPHNDKTHISKRVKKGEIVKIDKGQYQFISECGLHSIENLADHMIESEQRETRNVSAMLRFRIDPAHIVEKVLSKFTTISSFHKVIEKVLRLYIEVPPKENTCPECGGQISYTEGCLKCVGCGYSKCG